MNKVKEYLNKDIKEFNVKLLVISGILFLFIVGLISYKVTMDGSYALFTDDISGTKTLTFHYDPARTVTFDPDGGTIPEGSKWTGSGNSATKSVTTGLKYGDLPIPTKEGYTFKGWNGKNLFSDENLVTSNNWSANQNVLVTKTDEYVQVLYNQNSSTPGYIYSLPNRIFQAGNTYTVSILAKGVNSNSLSLFFYGNTLPAATLDTSKFTVSSSTFTYAEQTSNNTYMLLFRSGPTINTGFQIKWLMVEAGSTATEYEPYYITEDTKVVQTSNHILKAIWEAN